MVAEGTRLTERYELRRRIGSGGLGDVWLANDVVLKRSVAVKILRGGEEEDLRRFRDEARVQATLTHPSIVPLYDAGSHEDMPYLVMAYVEGRPLSQLLSDGALSPDRVRAWGAQIAGALGHAHGHGVVHRDVKPGNVIVDGEDAAHLTDFGIARHDDSARVTRTGMVIGTAAYVAPEQLRDEAVTSAADIYSFGLVLLEALTGRTEYTGPPLEAAMARLHREPDVPADLPAPWPVLLSRMLTTEAHHRPTAAHVAEQLSHPEADLTERISARASEAAATGQVAAADTEHLAGPRTQSVSAADTQQVAREEAYDGGGPRPRRGRSPWPLVVVVALALLVAGALVLLPPGAQQTSPPGQPESLDEALDQLEKAIQP